MKRWNVIFTTYEEYEVEAETENDAMDIAAKQLFSDRSSSVASKRYDDCEIECLDEDDEDE